MKKKKAARTKQILVRVLDEEQKAFQREAMKTGEGLSSWVRRHCRLAAGLSVSK